MARQLIKRYTEVRAYSERLCSRLEIEDYVVQPADFVSPPKWHLAHCTWFFEELLLIQFSRGYQRFNAGFRRLFNSYYKSAGEHWLQAQRGQLSRPSVKEVYAYRAHVDEHIVRLLEQGDLPEDALALLELGLQHEQQHQELLVMDIKYILASNPELPAYQPGCLHEIVAAEEFTNDHRWLGFSEGLRCFGAPVPASLADNFVYDNECGRHQVFLTAFTLRERAVSNAEYLQFIEDGAYQNPSLWLSKGWDWLQAQRVRAPLYWRQQDGQWQEYTLYGSSELVANAPVTHISYFEADAFARWAGYRLASEFELECLLNQNEQPHPNQQGPLEQLHPYSCTKVRAQNWAWTHSHYSAYPGFKPFEGMVSEYNGKFMCGQFVLRGGCIATPIGHFRPSYRNFYLPDQRWMFSGLRLAKDV